MRWEKTKKIPFLLQYHFYYTIRQVLQYHFYKVEMQVSISSRQVYLSLNEHPSFPFYLSLSSSPSLCTFPSPMRGSHLKNFVQVIPIIFRFTNDVQEGQCMYFQTSKLFIFRAKYVFPVNIFSLNFFNSAFCEYCKYSFLFFSFSSFFSFFWKLLFSLRCFLSYFFSILHSRTSLSLFSIFFSILHLSFIYVVFLL